MFNIAKRRCSILLLYLILYVGMCLNAHAVIRGSHRRLVYSIELPIKTFSGAGSFFVFFLFFFIQFNVPFKIISLI